MTVGSDDGSPESLLPPPQMVRMLDENGQRRDDDRFPVTLSDEGMLDLYRYMVQARRVDQEAIHLQRQGQLGVYASLQGQEAAQVGSASALQEQDWVFPAYREGGAVLVRGMDPAKVLHQYRGTWFFDHDPYEDNFALWTTPIGTQTLHAVGFAMGARLDGSDAVVLTYLGDGATSEGDPHEAMNFAGVFRSPCIFFIQNNQYAISTPLARQTAAPSLAYKGVGYGIPSVIVDGNDVLACHAVTTAAVQRARAGGGPTLVEAITYRMEAHTTSDDTTRYREQRETDTWRMRDPIERYGRYLRDAGQLDDAAVTRIDEEADRLAATVRAEIFDAPQGDPLEVFDHVFVEPGTAFDRQREQMRREIAAATDQA